MGMKKLDTFIMLSIIMIILEEVYLKKSNNTMITIIVIADILVQIKTKNKRTQEKIFKDFNIDNIPKNQYNYQN